MHPALYPRADRPARPSPGGALCAAVTPGLSSLGSLPVVMNGPNDERRTAMAKNDSETITHFGKGPVEKLRALVQEGPRVIRRTEALVPPSPPPRYDEVFARGQQWLDRLAADEYEL